MPKRFLQAAVVLVLVSAAAPAATSRTSRPPLPSGWQSTPPVSAFGRLSAVRGKTLTRVELGRVRAAGMTESPPQIVIPRRTGDLDGDGRNDLMAIELGEQDGAVRFRRGLDGIELWSLPDSTLAQAVTIGEGRVLAISDIGSSVTNGVTAYRERVELFRGDGTALWTFELPSVVVRLGNPALSAGGDVLFVAALSTIADATGDGVTDVFVGTLNGAYADAGIHIEGDVFTGHVLDGVTGDLMGVVAAANSGGRMPWVVPGNDVSGDGLADVFSLSSAAGDLGILSAYGSGPMPIWQHVVRTGFAYPYVADVTGDGASDLVLQSFAGGAVTRDAYDGTDGTALWSIADNGYTDITGDIDGDGGSDLLQISTPDAHRAVAFSGSTGETLWGPVSFGTAPGAFLPFCVCTDDITGDGIWDPQFAEVTDRVLMRVVDGSDGTELWTLDPGPNGAPVPVGADVDGDGAVDVAQMASDGSRLRVIVRRGIDLSPLWTAAATTEASPGGGYADDVAGDGALELVLATSRLTEEALVGGAMAIGPTGTLWSFP